MPDIINTPNTIQPEIKKYSAQDKEGAAIWQAREAGEPTRDRVKAFEEKYQTTFNEWQRSMGLQDGKGMVAEKAKEIIEQIEQEK